MLLYAYCRQEGEDVNDVILQQTHLTTMLCFLDSKGIERTLRSFTTAASYIRRTLAGKRILRAKPAIVKQILLAVRTSVRTFEKASYVRVDDDVDIHIANASLI
jgi:hypothetical protein